MHLSELGLKAHSDQFFSNMPKRRRKSAEKGIFGKNGKKMKKLSNYKSFQEIVSLLIFNRWVKAFKGKKGALLSKALRKLFAPSPDMSKLSSKNNYILMRKK